MRRWARSVGFDASRCNSHHAGPVNRAVALALVNPLHELPSKLGIHNVHISHEQSSSFSHRERRPLRRGADAAAEHTKAFMERFLPGEASMQAFMLAGGISLSKFEMLGMPPGFGGATLCEDQRRRLLERVEEIHELRCERGVSRGARGD